MIPQNVLRGKVGPVPHLHINILLSLHLKAGCKWKI